MTASIFWPTTADEHALLFFIGLVVTIAIMALGTWGRAAYGRAFAARKAYREQLATEVEKLLLDRQYPRRQEEPQKEPIPPKKLCPPPDQEPGTMRRVPWPDWPPMSDCPIDRRKE